jgi:hypothetical protein
MPPEGFFASAWGSICCEIEETPLMGWHEGCCDKTWRLVMRILFYIRHYVLPPASFGVFVAAEAAILYGLYRAFVAP